jgi:hypothetical protein
LCELDDWLVGQPTCQMLFRIEDMTEWHFYDDSEWRNSDYEDRLRYRWERVSDAKRHTEATQNVATKENE